MRTIFLMTNNLIPTPLDKYGDCFFHADETLFHVAINDVYAQSPEKFGSYEIQQSLREKIRGIVEAQQHPDHAKIATVDRTTLPHLAALFKEHEIEPLAQVRIAFLGCNPQTLEYAKELTRTMRAFADFHPERTEVLDCSTWEKYIADGKFDYVLTGNVLNDPKFAWPSYTMTGIASVLKKGGKAIHALNYSDDHWKAIHNKNTLDFIGQKIESQLNRRARTFSVSVDALTVLQEREVAISHQYHMWARQTGALAGEPEYLRPEVAYLRDRPELLPAIGYSYFREGQGKKAAGLVQQFNKEGEVIKTLTRQEFSDWFDGFRTTHGQQVTPSPAMKNTPA